MFYCITSFCIKLQLRYRVYALYINFALGMQSHGKLETQKKPHISGLLTVTKTQGPKESTIKKVESFCYRGCSHLSVILI